jgi:hypothetical protein
LATSAVISSATDNAREKRQRRIFAIRDIYASIEADSS